MITCDTIYTGHVESTLLSDVQLLLGFGEVLNVFLEDKPRLKWSLYTKSLPWALEVDTMKILRCTNEVVQIYIILSNT